MSIWKCSGCDYTNDRKQHVERHINKLKKCNEVILQIIEVSIEINCEHCNKMFTSERSLKRHLKSNCKVLKADELFEKDQKIKELEEKLAKAEALVQKPTTINNDNSTNTYNIININLTPYNDPKLEGAEKYYKEAVKKLFMSVPHIIQRVHFNEELPENHNICITNFRSKMAKVFTGKKWKTMDEDELIDELVNTYENLLEDWAGEKPERMKYIEKYKEIKERDGAEKVEKDLRDEVKKLIYDNRDMIKIKN